MEGYVIVTCIGKGSSGAVYLARSKRIKGADISMVLEYCDGGTMQDRIENVKNKNSQIPESKILEWTAQITSAVDYIHERKILHRDLKSENVFLLKNETVKLGDFGISKEIDHTLDKANTCVGTPCYLSPELCQDIPYNFKSDIWALGCLVFEMCALKPAFDAANLISLFYKIVNGKYSSLPNTCSISLKELVAKILVRDPKERPTANQLLRLPILQRYASQIRMRTPELTGKGDQSLNAASKLTTKNHFDVGDLDDLDELLNQAEKEMNFKTDATPSKVNHNDHAVNNRSVSVHNHFSVSQLDDLDFDDEANRPQTCPHSASTRPEAYTPADTIATWSGYGDRGSKRPSAVRRLSGDSDLLSDSDSSTVPEPIPTQRDYSSDEFSSLSDDDQLNTSRTTATIDEEIPEEIESVDDTRELTFIKPNSTNVLGATASRNLPGSAWLQSKRAQVLRQKEQLPQIVSSLSKHSLPVTSLSLGSKSDFISVKKNNSYLEIPSVHQGHKGQNPSNSWLKEGFDSTAKEIVLGAPIKKADKRKRSNLPGSGWLLSKSHESHRKEINFDYADDFEDYDDDFEQDDDFDKTMSDNHVSSLELVRQKCVDSIGEETFEHLSRLFASGFSISDAYEKCKENVDFETVETCYVLLNK